MIFSTVLATGSSSKKAMSAQLSRTLVAISQFALALTVCGHRLEHAFAFQRTAQAANIRTRDRLQQNAFRRCDDRGLGSLFDLKLFAELPRNHYLAFDRERNSFRFKQCIHYLVIRY